MSNWTHVAGVVRIDDLRFDDEHTPDFDELFGKECLFHSPEEVWNDMEMNPDKYLPMGSEGSLQKSVWVNPNASHMASYTISIFGDLRNHEDPQAILDWFKKRLEKLVVRQATITVHNECNGTVNWTYED